MDEGELLLRRIERLQAAVDKLDGGNMNAFGRRMGLADGAYIRQLLAGTRPISEKFIWKVESLPGLFGWFESTSGSGGGVGMLLHQIRVELEAREIPEHVLTNFLTLLRGFPIKTARAA